MQSKLSRHNQQLDTFIEHKYNDWIYETIIYVLA